jgi:general stress protein 26
VRPFKTAMFVTQLPDHGIRARPLSIAGFEEQQLWFATGKGSGKAHELQANQEVGIVMQSWFAYVSISARAHAVVDRVKAAALWRETWRPWFPNGADDPELVLISAKPVHAEYWDLRGVRGLEYMLEAVRHALQRKRMDDKATSPFHGQLDFAAA